MDQPLKPVAMSITACCSYLDCSRSHLDELRRHAGFPTPVSLGGQRIAFLVQEVDAWLAARPRAATEIGRKGLVIRGQRETEPTT